MEEKNTSTPTLTLEVTAYTKAQILRSSEAHIALAGRSNVGKSSLINTLAGRKSLAKISATPGKTRSLNFYRVHPDNFYLVDLPGYGYARCSKKERHAWGELMQDYLISCRELCALALLLDCRLPPQKLDRQLADFATAHHIPLLPILTKADKCKQKERAERQSQWADICAGIQPVITSATKKIGIISLFDVLKKTVHACSTREE